jgi:2,3-bisphosphoglycerate-independent phosphoglycerate mutase
MITDNGQVLTSHTTNTVPCIVGGMGDIKLVEGGKLSDLAPTLLEMMKVDQPKEMTGHSIIKKS